MDSFWSSFFHNRLCDKLELAAFETGTYFQYNQMRTEVIGHFSRDMVGQCLLEKP